MSTGTCAACRHSEDDHATGPGGDGGCWVCGPHGGPSGKPADGCPDGYIPERERYDPAKDHNAIPGLTIRVHGSS